MAKRFHMPVKTHEYPVYSKKQERAVLFEYHYSLDEEIRKEAKDNLILHNMGLIYSIIIELTKNDENAEPDTLVSYGVEGLVKAIDKFELARDCKLSTYAYMWIYKYIHNGIQEQTLVHLPSGVYEKIAVFQRVQNELKNILEREPTYKPFSIDGADFSEMEDVLVNGDYGFTPAMYKNIVMAWNLKNPSSLNAAVEDDRGKELEYMDTIEDVEGTKRDEQQRRISLMRTEFEKVRTAQIKDASKVADMLLYMLDNPNYEEKEIMKEFGLKDRYEFKALRNRGFGWLRDNSIDLTLQLLDMN